MRKGVPVHDRQDDAQRTAILVTTLIAGVVGAAFMYWTWRQDFGVPLQLTVSLHMDPASSPVRPWALWLVPVIVTAPLAMGLWRVLVARAQRMSMLGGVLAILAICYLTYGVGIVCLEYGAMMQYVPRPPSMQLLAALPMVLLEALQVILLYLVMGFPFGWILIIIVCVIVGTANVAIGRTIARASPVHSGARLAVSPRTFTTR
jgi:hypothetical protein